MKGGSFNQKKKEAGSIEKPSSTLNSTNGTKFRSNNNSNSKTSSSSLSNNSSNNSASLFFENSDTTKNFDDRQDYLLVNSIGSNVVATTTSGIKYSGILIACDLESKQGISIILKYPKIIDSTFKNKGTASTTTNALEDDSETLLLSGKDVADLKLDNVNFAIPSSASNSTTHATNSAIASSESSPSASAATTTTSSTSSTPIAATPSAATTLTGASKVNTKISTPVATLTSTKNNPMPASVNNSNATKGISKNNNNNTRTTNNNNSNGAGFKTDVDISKTGMPIKQRELQRWTPDNSDLSSNNLNNGGEGLTLEESSYTWDQFAVNEKKFGVTSSFDEHFYTTKINKNDPNYATRLKEAERIAKEIESQGTSGNIHLAEDRGIIIDDSGMDEEDLYSGVDRRGDELLAALKTNAKPTPQKPSRYIPPTLRNEPHNMDPAIISSSTSKKTVKNFTSQPQQPHIKTKQPNNTEATAISGAPIASPPLKKATTPANTSSTTATTSTSKDSETKPNGKTQEKEKNPITKTQMTFPSKLNKPVKPPSSGKPGIHGSNIPISLDSINFKKKDAQIEAFKNFSQNLKVPYAVPEDMKKTSKQDSSSLSNSSSTFQSRSNSKTKQQNNNNNNNNINNSPQNKNDLNNINNINNTNISNNYNMNNSNINSNTRSSGNSRIHSQGQTSMYSPASSRINTSSRRRNHMGSFFGSKPPQADANKKKLFSKNFNFFTKSKESYDEKIAKQKTQKTSTGNEDTKVMEPFLIEKPYFTAPTWESTVDQSYKSLFPEERSVIQRAQMRLQQRHMNSMNAAAAAAAANSQMGVAMGNMVRFPIGSQGSPGPMMGNMGMYMPFQPQPMFYPGMPQMMGMIGSNDDISGSQSPQPTPGHFQPAYMNTAPNAAPLGGFGYPAPIPFQTMVVGGGDAGPGGRNNYRQNYHHHNNNNHGHNNHHHYANNNTNNNHGNGNNNNNKSNSNNNMHH
ncbi:hypothetical protein TBLA_0H02140 [Henningerozyma blattae CBS 6284]|uniref:LsmAD domain-containing protein n=1 Tax=Henningerozyma blattae (strain ATCC 34711 / CBS 6284 / DSM 70876 / NBRC 10599 / NRRL Y-10934 / UCD 77-7) TaxID=1071380 RepID=I2H7Z8_HENB6|nr:hypothetical protein TBLA_0H02140 [Tetrapisispora blattae CBS 6284]CCH62500.1 hypothetical protein TBLA_0H02140 [Tetrapisispora blattae CBS 6284]